MNDRERIELKIKNCTLQLPENYPAQAGSVMFLTPSVKGCLMLYQIQEWLPMRDKLFNFNTKNKRIQSAIRWVIGHGEELIVANGKTLFISKKLCQIAGLNDEVLWISTPQCIKLWKPVLFEEQLSATLNVASVNKL